MNFTQEQIKEILQDIANGKNGFNEIMKMSLDVLMVSERKLHQHETRDDVNGYFHDKRTFQSCLFLKKSQN